MGGNIVLVGPMASGKSTVGAALARRLSRPHLDTDHFFVARNGPIRDYFLHRGEEAFRAEEERIVAELLDSPRPSVISLGGGAVLSAATRRLLQDCFVVMLDVTEAQAEARIGDQAPARLRRAGARARRLARRRRRGRAGSRVLTEVTDRSVTGTPGASEIEHPRRSHGHR